MVSSTGDGFTKAAANVGLGPAAAGPGPISPISNPLANPISSGPPPLTSSTGNAAGFKDFMESNNLVAKIAFLLLVIFVFIILLQLCVKLLVFFFDTSSSPYLINGMVRANQPIAFPQDPASQNAKPLQRSINGPDGIEFTWSIWIYIDSLPEHSIATNYLHIFNKGNSDVVTVDSNEGTAGGCIYGADIYPGCVKAGLVQPNNAPGLYIAPGTNELVVIMNTFDNINNEILIPNIPLNKWINVIIRCQNTTLDIYINGTIAKSIDLGYVPKQNYGDVYTSLGGGFDGYISNLRYYNYALGTSAIQSITQIGPNIKTVDSTAGSGMSSKYSKYLSLNWYFAGNDQSGGFY